MGLHSVRVNNQYRVEFSKQVPGTETEQPAMTIETNYFGITYNDAVEEALFFSSLLKTALHIFPYKIGINYKYPNHFCNLKIIFYGKLELVYEYAGGTDQEFQVSTKYAVTTE